MPADDDAASGPPPHPLDRIWFHPTELGGPGGPTAPFPGGSRSGRPRPWLVAAVAFVVGAVATVGVLAAAGSRFGRTGPEGPPVVGSRLAASAEVSVPADLADLVAERGPGVVTVTVTPPGGDAPVAVGSGVSVASGRVVTAAHLVAGAGGVAIVTAGGRVVAAVVIGTDPETDLVVLRVDDAALAPVEAATDGGLRVGQPVVSLGTGPGPRPLVATGLVSAVDAVVALPDGRQGVAFVRTDARPDPQAVGGAVLEPTGRLVGVLTDAGGTLVPVAVVRDVVTQVVSAGRVAHGWVGIVAADAVERPGGGARVLDLVDDGPGHTAGLVPGDVVVAVAGRPVANAGDLAALVRRLRPGDPVELTVVRAGERARVPVELGRSIRAEATGPVVA